MAALTDPNALSNREVALLAWLIVVFLVVLVRRAGRRSLGGIVLSLLHPKLLVPLLMFIAWEAAAVWVGRRLGIWEVSLAKDTAAWVLVAGPVVFSRFVEVGQSRFFRRSILALVALPEVISFLVDIVPFALWLELVLPPLLVLMVGVSVVAGRDPKDRQVKRWVDRILSVLGLLVVVWAFVQIALSVGQIDWHYELLAFYLRIWLTVAVLPFVYLLGVYSHYEDAFIRVDLGPGEGESRWQAKAALVLGFGLKVRELDAFVRSWDLEDLKRAATFAGARDVVRRFTRRQAPERPTQEE